MGHARNAEYNPKRFAAVIMRIREPKTTALIFKSGKMVVTGAKSEEQARNAARKYARIIQKLDFPARFTEFKIQNIVASCDVKFPIRLEGLAYKHSHYSSYEPELFPGLIYRMVQPKIVLLVFVSGKVVLTGGKVRNEIYAAFEQIYPVLQEFRKAVTAANGVRVSSVSTFHLNTQCAAGRGSSRRWAPGRRPKVAVCISDVTSFVAGLELDVRSCSFAERHIVYTDTDMPK